MGRTIYEGWDRGSVMNEVKNINKKLNETQDDEERLKLLNLRMMKTMELSSLYSFGMRRGALPW